MNINRHNYEEFLLLYVDGELPAAQAKELECFVEQNPDIQQELNSLLDAKLQAEDIPFGDISVLLQEERDAINANNYQEHFLLYVDNELSAQQRKQTETFVLQHPHLQTNFTTLNKTKLPNETIEYTNKPKLYKRERTVVFYLQRLAVAAAFIGAMFFVWVIAGKNNTATLVATTTTPKAMDSKTVTQPTQQQNTVLHNTNVTVQQNTVTTNTAQVNKVVEAINGLVQPNKNLVTIIQQKPMNLVIQWQHKILSK